jgi:hypothetical protein
VKVHFMNLYLKRIKLPMFKINNIASLLLINLLWIRDKTLMIRSKLIDLDHKKDKEVFLQTVKLVILSNNSRIKVLIKVKRELWKVSNNREI